MTSDPRDSRSAFESTRRLLIRRVRYILVTCFVAGAVFAGLELWTIPRDLQAPFYVKIVGLSLITTALAIVSRPWAIRYAWPLSIAIVCGGYVMTAISGIVSPSREYSTTAVLFVAAALTTATVLPWGLWPQCMTLVVAAVALGVAVLRAEGTLAGIVSDPGAAVLIAFGLSAFAAREMNRFRSALRRELQVRRRAQMALQRLNAHLESRIVERTAELEISNRALAEEVVERRKFAEALRVSRAQLADIVDHSTAIISLKDRDARYLLINREFERCFGVTRSNVLGYADRDVFPAALAERLGARDAEVLAAGAPVSFEQDVSFDQVPHAHVCVKFPLRDADGVAYGVGSVSTDISRLLQLQEEVRRHQDELAHVLRLHTIGEMAAALAHEINQPLCAIANYAQGGTQRLLAGRHDELLQALEQITHESLRAGDILRGIRNLVKRESHADEHVDINQLAAEAVRVLEPQARLHGVTVRLDSTGDIPTVHADSIQIEQVIVNLMLNGVEAVADAGVSRREVVVATTVQGEDIEVAVSDTADGVAAHVADKLFQPFVTTKPRGLGLGLAISRSIVETHGGRLWATPNSGAGMTFHFCLPIPAERLPQRARARA